MNKSWTRNQKILISMVIISLLTGIFSIMFAYLNYNTLSSKQTIIVHQLEETNSKVGNFEKIFTSYIYLSSKNSTILNNAKNSGFACNETCCWTFGSTGGKNGAC